MRTDAYRQHTGEGSGDFGKDAKRIKHMRNCFFALSCGCEALRIGTYRLSEQTQALEMNLKEQRKPWALPGTEHPPAKATPRRSAVSRTCCRKPARQLSKQGTETFGLTVLGERGGRSHQGVLSPAATPRFLCYAAATTMRPLHYAAAAGRDASVLAARIPCGRPGVPPALAHSSSPVPGEGIRGLFSSPWCAHKGCVREWEEASRRAPGNTLSEQGFAQHLSSGLGAATRCKCRNSSPISNARHSRRCAEH